MLQIGCFLESQGILYPLLVLFRLIEGETGRRGTSQPIRVTRCNTLLTRMVMRFIATVAAH